MRGYSAEIERQMKWFYQSLSEKDRRRYAAVEVEKLGFVKRKAHKTLALGSHPDRDAQFQNIAQLKQEFLDAGQPVLSIDTKKKEHLGTLSRESKLYSRDEVRVYDHDFPSSATGVVIPYGIYDLAANVGHVTLGTSHDTSEFSCECLARWWEDHGRQRYPTATPATDPVRWRRQQCFQPARLLSGTATPGGSAGPGTTCGTLSTVLLEVQPHRTPRLPARDSGVPRRRL